MSFAMHHFSRYPGLEIFLQEVRTTSRETLASLSVGATVIANLPDPQALIFGHWMCLIQLVGPTFRVTLKVHFNSRFAKSLYQVRLKLGEQSDEVFAGLLKEFCNLYAGALKSKLAQLNVPLGVSIPFVTRGYDELHVTFSRDHAKIFDAWCLNSAEGSVICSVHVSIDNEAAFESIHLTEQNKCDDDNMEFL